MFALIAALTAVAALVLQLVLIVDHMGGEGASSAQALWRFLGFFTILTNIGVAAVAAAMALRPQSPLASARVRMASAVSICAVGIVYSVALRGLWRPTGWQAVADHALHDVTPVLFMLAWFTGAHGGLRWQDAPWGIVWPSLYCAYAMIRGAADGWYAYWFLDPTTQDAKGMATSVAILIAAFYGLALLLIAVDRRLARGRPPAETSAGRLRP